MDKLTLYSYAKLNLYLEVLNKRKDNYHNLKTLFERIDLADKIILKSRPDTTIKISSNSKEIPRERRNLVYRAAKLLQDACGTKQGFEIKIIKNIPVASGLGGGSSNAASVLVGLNKLWKLGLTKKRLVSLAKNLGSDVPFFIYDCPFALAGARGDQIKLLHLYRRLKLWHILVVPKLAVPTAKVYKTWDKQATKAKLTKNKQNVKILVSSLRKRDLGRAGEALFNSLESITFKLHPQLVSLKEKLKRLGLKSILMSGSGPAIFAICSSRKEAESIYQQLKEIRHWRTFLACTH